MVKRIVSHVQQYAARCLNRILAGIGVNHKAFDTEPALIRHGTINDDVGFCLYSPPEKPPQDMPAEIRGFHQRCRDRFYGGQLFKPLAETRVPGVIIHSQIIENEDENTHFLTVYPQGYERDHERGHAGD